MLGYGAAVCHGVYPYLGFREEASELVQLMRSMPVRYMSHGDLIIPALELAESHALTVYDALYLALARKQNVHLFTVDEQLARIASILGLSGGAGLHTQ